MQHADKLVEADVTNAYYMHSVYQQANMQNKQETSAQGQKNGHIFTVCGGGLWTVIYKRK